MKEKSIIKFENFSFRYDSANEFILKNINLEINKNELVILAGPTGCGKSTLLRSIIGLIPHMHGGEYKGKVIVDQLVVNDVKITDLAKKEDEKIAFSPIVEYFDISNILDTE